LTGPIDLHQLQLENMQMTDIIASKNVEFQNKRYSIALTKAKKTKFKNKLRKFQAKEQDLMKTNE